MKLSPLRTILGVAAAAALCAFLCPARAAAQDTGQYGTLLLGPRVGAALGVSGPRGGYYLGLALTYSTPRYFSYSLEAAFLHLAPRTVSVDATEEPAPGGTGTVVVAPDHRVRLEGLYGVPITFEVALRLPLRRVTLRAGVGIGAMVTVQSSEAYGSQWDELVASFCFRPGLGADVVVGSGRLRVDVAYLWQDAKFVATGGSHDVDTVFITLGYGWVLYG